MNYGKETVVDCGTCGQVFVAAGDDDSLFKTLFGHEVECPHCGAWCDFKFDDERPHDD